MGQNNSQFCCNDREKEQQSSEIVLITPRTALKKRASKSVYSINKSFFESQHIMNLNLKLGAHQIKNGDEEMV